MSTISKKKILITITVLLCCIAVIMFVTGNVGHITIIVPGFVGILLFSMQRTQSQGDNLLTRICCGIFVILLLGTCLISTVTVVNVRELKSKVLTAQKEAGFMREDSLLNWLYEHSFTSIWYFAYQDVQSDDIRSYVNASVYGNVTDEEREKALSKFDWYNSIDETEWTVMPTIMTAVDNAMLNKDSKEAKARVDEAVTEVERNIGKSQLLILSDELLILLLVFFVGGSVRSIKKLNKEAKQLLAS